MPVRIEKSNAAPKRSVFASWAFKTVATILLCLTSSTLFAQSGRQIGTYDPIPDEHRPPSPTDMDKMAPAGPSKPPVAGNSATDDTCLLPPLNLTSHPSIAATQLQIPAKARKEYQKACSSLKKKKNTEAEKHLQKAVSQSPKYAAAWVTLGQVLAAERRMDEARRACDQGSSADVTYVLAYLCLADIAARQNAWEEVLKFSGKAIELDPANNTLAYEYHAAANLNLHELAAAEKSALRALDIDRDHREPRVHFVLAQIYEAKGDRINEVAQLRDYLRYAGNLTDVAAVKQALAELENEPAGIKSSRRLLVGSLTDLAEAAPPRWAPAEIDERVPPVLSSTTCPLPQILQETSNRTLDLIDNLQRFSANERVEQTDTDKNGKTRISKLQDLNYVVQIGQNSSGYPTVEEYRSGTGEAQQTSMMDTGTAAFALIFHPTHIGNFDFRCEGLTELRGAPAWQVHFEESPDPNRSFIAIRARGSVYLPRFKGRAWIATTTSDVLRIETDLVSPIPEIDLQLEHMVIDYAPVEFQKTHVRLWLPESTTLYVAYRGHRYEKIRNFGDFQLFSVDSTEAIKTPKVDKFGSL